MEFVIDANVMFAALIKNGITIALISEPSITLFTPEYIFEEFLNHKEEILKKTKRTEQELNEILELFKKKLIVIPKLDFENHIETAKIFSPDIDDTIYLALSLKLAIPIWSNDKDLKEKQNIIKVYNTTEVYDSFLKEQSN